MIKRFISYYKPHLRLLIADLIASLLVAGCDFLFPIFTRSVLYTYIPEGNIRFLVIFFVILLGIYIIKTALNYFIAYYGHIIGVDMQASMRRQLFAHLQRLPYSYYDENETGGIMSRLVNDLFDISELAHHGPEEIFTSAMSFIGAFIYLMFISAPLTLIIFTALPILVFFTLKMRGKMHNAFLETKKELSVINASLENSVTGIRVSKAFTNAEFEQQRFEKGNSGFVKARTKAYKAMAQFFAGSGFIISLLNVIVLFAGGMFTMNGVINYADLVTFMLFINMFVTPIRNMINFMEQYQDGMAGFKRFIQILDAEEEKDEPDAQEIKNIRGDVEFRNVSFTYEASGEVLHNINLSMPHGTTLALVGPSGGGKTTICHLIPRFYNASGEILIDGIPVTKIKTDSLRKAIGIVQQDVFLFNGTVRENILYGKLDATEEELINASVNANIYDYIMSLPEGFDTQVGERGVKLSGGQKQRISIARVFLKNPSVLILDEATSALDNATEILIRDALNKLAKGRTTLVVAHRLSTIRGADCIAVISEGHVAECGTHEELINKEGGIYKELYEAQFVSESDGINT